MNEDGIFPLEATAFVLDLSILEPDIFYPSQFQSPDKNVNFLKKERKYVSETMV